ncbi:outer membrane protein [Lysobacter capsici AZ78]|jgi:hypothetical protein|uniref:Outer membrane protein n=1 Tax=Lysobacter capsici AZ78 TaxID=1444315 RepID=A0A108UCV6_9GAMM|nr:hypothetical protein [Lysobacter capsici]KWS06570.1 outer membrane protein [Lysobacter capsici AZ78]
MSAFADLRRGLAVRTLAATVLSLACAAAFAAPPDDPDIARLNQRVIVIESNPDAAQYGAFERLRARQAIDAVRAARSRDRAWALRIADRRVETAEIVTRTQLAQREVDRLDRERSELLVEASRRDADRARAETERLRVQAQIQAEEAERLRLAADQEAQARAEAEGLLDNVAGQQAAKLRAARERDAELARKEAELMGEAPPKPAPKPKPKKK